MFEKKKKSLTRSGMRGKIKITRSYGQRVQYLLLEGVTKKTLERTCLNLRHNH